MDVFACDSNIANSLLWQIDRGGMSRHLVVFGVGTGRCQEPILAAVYVSAYLRRRSDAFRCGMPLDCFFYHRADRPAHRRLQHSDSQTRTTRTPADQSPRSMPFFHETRPLGSTPLCHHSSRVVELLLGPQNGQFALHCEILLAQTFLFVVDGGGVELELLILCLEPIDDQGVVLLL